MAKPNLTAERLRELLHYDPETGIFTRIAPRRGARSKTAGFRTKYGYVAVPIDWTSYLAHRLAFLFMTGEMPGKNIEVDHIDGNGCNNIWANLRLCDSSLNKENQRRAKSSNKSGFLGVTRNHDRWAANIKVRGKRFYLGTFDSPEQAHAAYLDAKRKLHEGCTI